MRQRVSTPNKEEPVMREFTGVSEVFVPNKEIMEGVSEFQEFLSLIEKVMAGASQLWSRREFQKFLSQIRK